MISKIKDRIQFHQRVKKAKKVRKRRNQVKVHKKELIRISQIQSKTPIVDQLEKFQVVELILNQEISGKMTILVLLNHKNHSPL